MKQEYPKWLYHASGRTCVVADPAEHAAKTASEKGWGTEPPPADQTAVETPPPPATGATDHPPTPGDAPPKAKRTRTAKAKNKA